MGLRRRVEGLDDRTHSPDGRPPVTVLMTVVEKDSDSGKVSTPVSRRVWGPILSLDPLRPEDGGTCAGVGRRPLPLEGSQPELTALSESPPLVLEGPFPTFRNERASESFGTPVGCRRRRGKTGQRGQVSTSPLRRRDKGPRLLQDIYEDPPVYKNVPPGVRDSRRVRVRTPRYGTGWSLVLIHLGLQTPKWNLYPPTFRSNVLRKRRVGVTY